MCTELTILVYMLHTLRNADMDGTSNSANLSLNHLAVSLYTFKKTYNIIYTTLSWLYVKILPGSNFADTQNSSFENGDLFNLVSYRLVLSFVLLFVTFKVC